MNRREFLFTSAAATVGSNNPAGNSAIEVAAYYFPNYHPDLRNDRWHGKGWTEWKLVQAARPRFPGHQQPKVPAWGPFDESDPRWAAKEIDLAADHGVTAFIYDWYWYDDGPYLLAGLEDGFLRSANNQRLKFALMWANHDWVNLHPATFNNRPEKLAPGKVSRKTFETLTDHVVAKYFSRPNYMRVDGAPYFSIYDIGSFITGMGGLAQAREALDSFRAKVRAAGHPGVHLNVILWGIRVLPAEVKIDNPMRVITELGFSSVGSYCWLHHFDPGANFPKASYAKAAEQNMELWAAERNNLPVPYHPNVTMGWDPSPRTIQSDAYENRGYPWTAVLEGNTPAAFRSALARAKEFISAPESKQKVITLNAWNEWTEGSYLLPDKAHGTAYLQAVRDVFGRGRGSASAPGHPRE